uniref:Uncharacterized protein n=1 Tax=Saccharomyces cerevisiae TaxID=4932 RepID=E9PA75_YEASX|nr:unknown [Saccharomyces cerevisiae]
MVTWLSKENPFSAAASSTATLSTVAMAKIVDCGGLIIEVNMLTALFMPILDMQMVPPWNSSGANLFILARLTSSLISLEICDKPLASQFLTIGVNNPVGVATATETSTFLNLRITFSLGNQ